jgi:hypothetical protein
MSEGSLAGGDRSARKNFYGYIIAQIWGEIKVFEKKEAKEVFCPRNG